MTKTGLQTFADIDEISIVAAPGFSARYDGGGQTRGNQIVQNLLTHVERMRYRVAVIDAPENQELSGVRNFRGQMDSKYGALYYPWIKTLDPLDPDGRREILLPPSGYVTGIYARTDAEQGVFKAPANEVARGAIGFELLLNKAQQDILNPDGVNCFRFFEGRGFRLWGARTISSDPEWKYISVRRYFAYLEHSIDKGTQFAVFENNSPPLWANITQTVSDFLFNEWKSGALLGTKPEEAFFVRCDRSTMTQNDLDNGRLICLIGVAVVKPAEFVIFRIGQWTADRKV
jgi:phage tail sheath protein FI